MTQNHTPGPWQWVRNHFWDGYSGIVGPDNQEVLFPNTANDGDDGAAWFADFPSEADANLIIAAPDLLEAVYQLLKCNDAASQQWAREAIAKAEGRS